MVGSRAIPPYHAVGNRLTETTAKGETAYTYDPANRLASVNGQAVQWDTPEAALFAAEKGQHAG